ncbi:MAG: hypothetical protein ACI4LM_02190, partial [Anaerovoracaceae bacterium]
QTTALELTVEGSGFRFKTLSVHRPGHKITLLYSDSRGEYAYDGFWDEVRSQISDFDTHFITERDQFTGMTEKYAKANGNDSEYLIAGSPAVNDAFTELLKGLGVDESKIMKDKFMGY